jgi:hypothetical protein
LLDLHLEIGRKQKNGVDVIGFGFRRDETTVDQQALRANGPSQLYPTP